MLLTFPVTDYTGSVLVKIFFTEEEFKDFPLDSVKKGADLLIYGSVAYDDYDRDRYRHGRNRRDYDDYSW